MPVFDYECESCGHVFEHMTLKISAPGPEACPECQSDQLKKRIGASEFRFKGGGFYTTSNDYKRRRMSEKW